MRRHHLDIASLTSWPARRASKQHLVSAPEHAGAGECMRASGSNHPSIVSAWEERNTANRSIPASTAATSAVESSARQSTPETSPAKPGVSNVMVSFVEAPR